MKKLSIIKYVFLALMLVFLISCEKDDFTGDSSMKPKSPSITVSDVPAGGITLTEKDTTFSFDVTMSEAQTVDVALYIKQTGGDATADEDFKIENTNSRVYFPANTTTGKVVVSIMQDDLVEDTETLKIQIGDERTANAGLTPVEVNFTIYNHSSSVLTIDMSWDTDEADVVGLGLDPDEVVDLRMLIIDKATETVVAIEDGASFETYSSMDTLPDGDYLIATDIYSTIDAGDFNEEITLDLMIELNQDGVINSETMDFPGVMTNKFDCSNYRTNLATITKAGSSYTMTKSVSYSWSVNAANLVGAWIGLDDSYYEYDSKIITFVDNGKLMIDSAGLDWMEDFWGEKVMVAEAAEITFDWNSSGGIIIAEQYYYTTDFEGDLYNYSIVGTGSINTCAEKIEMDLKYDFINTTDGYSVGEVMEGYGYPRWLESTLTLSSGGKKSFVLNTPHTRPIPKSVKKQLLGK